jgi:hypothetical protein
MKARRVLHYLLEEYLVSHYQEQEQQVNLCGGLGCF